MPPPIAACVLVLAILGGLYGLVVAASSNWNLSPEVSRKLIHIGMGCTTLSFPWLFDVIWPVAILTAIAVVALLGLRIWGRKSQLGTALYSVCRSSGGDLYFPLSVLIIFTVAHHEPAYYVIPILIMTLADAGAALTGVRYGLVTYTGADGNKSAEGSFAFFSLAFFATHLPLLLMTDVGRLESVLIALTLSLLVTLLEAIAWRGLDNIFVPLGAFVLLKIYRELPVDSLLLRLLALTAIAVLVASWGRRTTLQGGALLMASLVGYASWSLGGVEWLLAPILLFISYAVLWPQPASRPRDHNIEAVLSVTGAGVVWLIASRLTGIEDFVVPYYMTFVAALTFVGIAWFRDQRPSTPRRSKYLLAVGKALTVLGLPLVFLYPANFAALTLLLSLAGLGAAYLYDRYIPERPDYTVTTFPWRRQRMIAECISLLGYLAYLGISP